VQCSNKAGCQRQRPRFGAWRGFRPIPTSPQSKNVTEAFRSPAIPKSYIEPAFISESQTKVLQTASEYPKALKKDPISRSKHVSRSEIPHSVNEPVHPLHRYSPTELAQLHRRLTAHHSLAFERRPDLHRRVATIERP
jgi:hypothetical protein